MVAVAVFSAGGKRLSPVTLASRGIFEDSGDDAILARGARQVQAALDGLGDAAGLDARCEAVRRSLRQLFKRELERRPVLVPVLLDLPHVCCD